MHELSICEALMGQLVTLAEERSARAIDRVVLRVGPLSGVEGPLLVHAFPIAAAGTVAEGAELVIESMPVRVRCTECGAVSEAVPNRLLCGACGDFRTRLESGDELVLASVEMLMGRDEAPLETTGGG